MKILAVDQARRGAWSIFDYEKKELIKYGTFEFDSRHYTFAQANLNIERVIESVIKENDVSAVFIEDIQMRQNVQSFKRLAQLQGVLVNLFEKNEYLYSYVAPTQWQNYCKARGRTTKEAKKKIQELEASGKKASKILSIEFVKQQFDIDTDNDNLADACCIGYYVVNNIIIERKENENED